MPQVVNEASLVNTFINKVPILFAPGPIRSPEGIGWPIRSLAKSLPGAFAPWPFRSLELLLPGTFARGSFAADIGGGRCVEMGGSQEVWGTAKVPKAPKAKRSSAIGSTAPKAPLAEGSGLWVGV